MATRFHFTTRDWFWLCLVLFLAMGWGSHVRYSMWNENQLSKPNPITDDDLKRQLTEEMGEGRKARVELYDLKTAIVTTLNEEQQKAIKTAAEEQQRIRQDREQNYLR